MEMPHLCHPTGPDEGRPASKAPGLAGHSQRDTFSFKKQEPPR